MAMSTSSIGSTLIGSRATTRRRRVTETEATTTRSSSQTCDALPPPCPPIHRAPRLPSPTNVDPPTQVGATKSNVLRSSQRKKYFLSSFPNHHFPPFLSLYLAPHWIWISRSIAIFFCPGPPPTPTTQPRTAPATESIDQREYQAAHSIRRRRCSFRAAPRP